MDHVAARKVQAAEPVQEAVRVPVPVGDGAVDEGVPEHHEDQHRPEPHPSQAVIIPWHDQEVSLPIGEGPADEGGCDDGEGELEHAEDRLGDSRC